MVTGDGHEAPDTDHPAALVTCGIERASGSVSNICLSSVCII